ncbi:hypothetical protein M2168_005960 [Streptomyces sp. CZ24]|nr:MULTISPECIES: hypothetical protein [unclassified Streptomyces]MBL0777299.1 hypothetical protein [Streptomyces albidoflavus]MCG5117447.1 hypothetical protein [Streptomyces sp. T7(2022)]MDH6192928.1 hypothetical protein [Streptomyces sp. CZ24]WTC05580.1 hypothetical protein OG794_28915 [Streptomyces albidoflavus]
MRIGALRVAVAWICVAVSFAVAFQADDLVIASDFSTVTVASLVSALDNF